MRIRKNLPIVATGIALLCSCTQQEQTEKPEQQIRLFTEVPADSTGINFSNSIEQSMDYNLYLMEYLFNGGGIAAGDINNDGLVDLYFSATLGNDKLYLNKGNMKFEDISEKAGIKNEGGVKTGVVMADVNNDGWLDIYICKSEIANKLQSSTAMNDLLFINNKDLSFTESAAQYGLVDKRTTTHATFFDYDLDGDLDLYLINHRIDYKTATRARLKQLPNGNIERIVNAQTPFESDILYRNNGDGSFTDVSKQAGIDNSSFSLSVSIADLNNDGWPDIYVANDFIDPDFCLINNKNGTFTDQIDKMFHHTSQNTMGTDIADFNNDGYPDLMALDMAAEDNYRQKSLMNVMMYDRYATLEKYGFGRQLGRNVLQLNNGNGSFSEIGEIAGVCRTDWSWAPLFADLDNDGTKDLFVSNGYRYDVTNTDYMKFTLDSLNKNVGLTSKEKLDIYLSHVPEAKLRNYAFRNKGGLRFEDVSTAWGITSKTYSNGCIYADLDNDGDLDLVLNNIDETATIYRNDQRQKTDNHYLQIRFNGPEKNPFGIGTRVDLISGDKTQMQELYSTRGFMSSVAQVLHFGLGKESTIKNLTVRWFDGKTQILNDVKADQLITLNYADAQEQPAPQKSTEQKIVVEVKNTGIDFTHRENEFVDFKREPLIPHQLSQDGPFIAVGDVNGDGLEDFFVGGAGAKVSLNAQGAVAEKKDGQAGLIYIQQKNSTFKALAQPALEKDKDFEDLDALFFDADGDNDLDLYVVSGSNEYSRDYALYQDRLYTNDGRGNFARSEGAIPSEVYSGSCVKAADYDGDGDLDLFVGGKLIPGSYPLSPPSMLLRNDKGKFTNVADGSLPEHGRLGMVYDATWQDLDGDNSPELIVVGEWMPVTILKNKKGKFENVTKSYGLENTNGWWNCITAIDYDKDGDMDFVAGNLGLNSRLHASGNQPLAIYAKDFDNNGSMDAITSCYNGGVEYPLPQKDLLLSQLPSLKKKYVKYNTYAAATMHDLYNEKELSAAYKLESKMFASSLIINNGKGKFELRPLTDEAQVAPVRDVLVTESNDLLLIGNSYQTEVETGLYDAFNGLLLANNGKELLPVHHNKSGFFANGDGRSLAQIKLADGNTLIIAAFNNNKVRTFLLKGKTTS